MFNFSLDFKKLVTDMLPPVHRKQILTDWITTLVSGVKTIHAQFKALVDKIRFDLIFTSQVIYLEYLLNYKFNGGLNAILINDGSNASSVYAYQTSENNNLFIVSEQEFNSYIDIFLYNEAEFTSYVDFLVMVPQALTFSRSEMTALINKYKLAGKSYTIKTY